MKKSLNILLIILSVFSLAMIPSTPDEGMYPLSEIRNLDLQGAGLKIIIMPPDVPHLFEALTDTVMLEWWDGPFEASYYQPYRRLVEKQF